MTTTDQHLNDWATSGPLGGFAQPIDRLARLHELERALRDQIRVEVALARRDGATWQEVGSSLGMKRQGAHERFA